MNYTTKQLRSNRDKYTMRSLPSRGLFQPEMFKKPKNGIFVKDRHMSIPDDCMKKLNNCNRYLKRE